MQKLFILVHRLQNCVSPKFVHFDLSDFCEYSPVHHYIKRYKRANATTSFFRFFWTANFEGP